MISNTLKRKMKLVGVTLSLVFSFILLSTDSVQAQWRNRDDRRMERRWGNTNKRAIENLIRRVEERTDRFINQLDRGLDNSRLDGTRREDRLNERARQLEGATDELRREFDRSDSLAENRDEVQRCISAAVEIDRVLRRRSRIGAGAETAWRNLRQELNALARAYSVRTL
jgi:uncharacterized membrane protein YccC